MRPSEINHGNIAPKIEPLGITCTRLEHTFVLSLAAIRRLRFGESRKDTPARSLIAALGLLALVEQDARGYALRSRCDLVCDGRAPIEVVHADGATSPVQVDRAEARSLFAAALELASNSGFRFAAEPLRLTPQDKLVEIVRKSQELALSGKGGEEPEQQEPAEDQ